MKLKHTIQSAVLLTILCCHSLHIKAQEKSTVLLFDFYGDSIQISTRLPLTFTNTYSSSGKDLVQQYFEELSPASYEPIVSALLQYKATLLLDDWLYYQLIRKTVQQFAPKQDNYERYTVYKWLLLSKSGYAATLKYSHNKLLFYVHTDEDVFNLPVYAVGSRQFVCLNYHDYAPINFLNEQFTDVTPAITPGSQSFSYKITQLPDFNTVDYIEKELQFNYYASEYNFKIKLNPSIKNIFTNYPVVDYASYFNIPLSKPTYESLIPLLKKETSRRNLKQGVDFLMRFTRYAFLFEPDVQHFGQEKRLSPEQTLLYDKSDCEDRAALFFFLVKEIYNLPMIVLSFPDHISIGVNFEKPVGKPIYHDGVAYTICEPTPQKQDLAIGKMPPALKKKPYEIVYVYTPGKK
ncbi:MAG TPA: hypothetical protein PKC39_07240 [Ferruginibacter sp.]|nr:hypothetical protein [Ferruginibacter sp.]HMP20736.1 hypothetical protein [Ferruginibacter sp.]